MLQCAYILIVCACGLDIGEFSFFAADVDGMLTDARATRRGIIALRHFAPGDTVMSISLDSAFSIDQMHRSKINHLVPVFRGLGMDDMAILIVTLMYVSFLILPPLLAILNDPFHMYEYSNPPSAWDAYLCTIPSSFTTTLYWPEAQLLDAVSIAPRLREFTDFRKHQFASNFLQHIPHLIKRYPLHFPASFFNFQNYVWAATASLSRSWSVDAPNAAGPSDNKPTFIMAPVLDLVNHQLASNHASLDARGRKFSIIAGPRGINEGTEVLLSYGRKCNAKLLADYGFAEAQIGSNALPECE